MDQVSWELQQFYLAQGVNETTMCNPLTSFNTWYARRACMLDPYNQSVPVWQEPEVECKPFTGYWTNVQTETVCDFLTEQITTGLVEQFGALCQDIQKHSSR